LALRTYLSQTRATVEAKLGFGRILILTLETLHTSFLPSETFPRRERRSKGEITRA
jgi:hypothetical protein